MKFVLLAVLILGLLSSQIHCEQEIDQHVYSQLQEIGKTQFGNTLMETVAVQLAAGDPAGDLISLLQNIEDQLRAEQDEDDEYILQLQQECDETLARLSAEIEVAREAVAQLTAELDYLIPERDTKEGVLEQKNEFLESLNQQLSDLEDRRVLKEQEWAEEQQQHDHATAVIERAKELIQNGVSTFLQTGATTNLSQVSSTLKSSIKSASFKRKEWSSFFNILAELTQDFQGNADPTAVQKVIEICDTILDKIADSRALERADFEHWMDYYHDLKGSYEELVDQTTTQIQKLEADIASLTRRISEAEYSKAEQERRVENKTTEHDEKLKYCDDENVAYAERRENRHDEKSIVSQTIGLLQANLRTFRKYIGDRRA